MKSLLVENKRRKKWCNKVLEEEYYVCDKNFFVIPNNSKSKIGDRVFATMANAMTTASTPRQFTTLTGIYALEPADNPPIFRVDVNGRSYILPDVLEWNNNSHPINRDRNVRHEFRRVGEHD